MHSPLVNRIVCLLLIAGTFYGTLPLPARGCGCTPPVKQPAPASCCPSGSCCPVERACCCETARAPDTCDCAACECGVPEPATPPIDPAPADEPTSSHHPAAAAAHVAFAQPAAQSHNRTAGHRSRPPADLVISLSRLIC
jgi:hypothetical protein